METLYDPTQVRRVAEAIDRLRDAYRHSVSIRDERICVTFYRAGAVNIEVGDHCVAELDRGAATRFHPGRWIEYLEKFVAVKIAEAAEAERKESEEREREYRSRYTPFDDSHLFPELTPAPKAGSGAIPAENSVEVGKRYRCNCDICRRGTPLTGVCTEVFERTARLDLGDGKWDVCSIERLVPIAAAEGGAE